MIIHHSALFYVTMHFICVAIYGQNSIQIDPDAVISIDSVNCTEIINGRHYSIRHDLYEAMDTLRFCMELDCDSMSPPPETRMVIILQNSPGMCSGIFPETCCTAGDGSGNCAQNDPEDTRIDILHEFIDNLKSNNLNVRVGLIIYNNIVTDKTDLLSLDPDEVSKLHTVLESAACRNVDNPVHTIDRNTAVNTGLALKEAVQLVDDEYDSAGPGLGRNIILITDGSWDDIGVSSPLDIYENYVGEFPDRGIPTVHAVFIHDSLLHVQHNYPAQGCHNGEVIDLSYLEYAADASGGLYFGLKGDNLIQNFTLLDNFGEGCCWVRHSEITNLSDNNTAVYPLNATSRGEEVQHNTMFKFTGLPLVTGENILTVGSSTGCYTKRDTITIYKSESAYSIQTVFSKKQSYSDDIFVSLNTGRVTVHSPGYLSGLPATVRIHSLSGQLIYGKYFRNLPRAFTVDESGSRKKKIGRIGIIQILLGNGEKTISKVMLY
jgi:hypothetical protein